MSNSNPPISVRAVPSAPRVLVSESGECPHGDPCTMILLGATGDLARRKLIAAVYDLAKENLLAEDFRLVGVDRTPLTDDDFRTQMRDAARSSDEIHNFDEDVWRNFTHKIFYVSGDFNSPAVYETLRERLVVLEEHVPQYARNRFFYLAVPPFLFEPIVRNLSESGLAPKTVDTGVRPWSRVVIEKPFGHDLQSARALSRLVLDAFNEHQIFRIDHYLGKETVQNILVFRAANAIFEPVWNRQHISHVQITAAETVGIGSRGVYYEHAGVVRDMFQNHLLQLLALTAMELPATMDADAVRDEKVKVLRTVRPFSPDVSDSMVRAQYSEANLGGSYVQGYRSEPHVSPNSTTPTFAALRLWIDNGRWRGVPFYLRSGKRMAKRVTEISIHFRTPPYLIDGLIGPTRDMPIEPNVLTIRVQPNDAITLRFEAKIPGVAMALTPEIEVTSVDMDFTYADAFGTHLSPAYETLLLDVMIGDATLFTRSDEVESGWRITDPLLERWAQTPLRTMPTYAAGTWGPTEADALLAQDGFRWRNS